MILNIKKVVLQPLHFPFLFWSVILQVSHYTQFRLLPFLTPSLLSAFNQFNSTKPLWVLSPSVYCFFPLSLFTSVFQVSTFLWALKLVSCPLSNHPISFRLDLPKIELSPHCVLMKTFTDLGYMELNQSLLLSTLALSPLSLSLCLSLSLSHTHTPVSFCKSLWFCPTFSLCLFLIPHLQIFHLSKYSSSITV
jgi:hypothetical protein